MDTNCRGVWLLTQAALPYIPKGGRIIIVGSISGRMGGPKQVRPRQSLDLPPCSKLQLTSDTPFSQRCPMQPAKLWSKASSKCGPTSCKFSVPYSWMLVASATGSLHARADSGKAVSTAEQASALHEICTEPRLLAARHLHQRCGSWPSRHRCAIKHQTFIITLTRAERLRAAFAVTDMFNSNVKECQSPLRLFLLFTSALTEASSAHVDIEQSVNANGLATPQQISCVLSSRSTVLAASNSYRFFAATASCSWRARSPGAPTSNVSTFLEPQADAPRHAVGSQDRSCPQMEAL